jgi:hypothetical protein
MKMGSTGARQGVRLMIAAAFACAAWPAAGADLDYRVSVGAGHSDNIQRAPVNEIDEDIASAGLRFAFDERTARLRADIVGDLAYYDYLDDTYDSEVVGNIYADTLFALVQDRLTWAVNDQFGQVLTDPFLPSTGENRENINYFSTGPDFLMGLGSQMRVRIGARYALVDYEESPLDSTNTGGQLALIREISDRSSMSLNASVQQIEYDAQPGADFDQLETYLRYQVEGSRTNLDVDAGFSQLDREAGDGTEGGLLLRVDASRRISGSSTVTLGLGREFTTSAGAFAGAQGIINVGLDAAPGRQTPDPFTLDQARLGWNFTRNVTSLSVSAGLAKRSYDDNPVLDQSTTTLAARLRRELSPTTSLELFASQTAVQFEPPAPDYQDMTAGASFGWRLTRNLTLDLRYDLFKRSADSAATEYTENRLWLSISYGRGEHIGKLIQ